MFKKYEKEVYEESETPPLHQTRMNNQLQEGLRDSIYLLQRDSENKMSFEEYPAETCKVTPKMRSILVDWLMTVHFHHNLSNASLFLAISILDRSCSSGKINVDRFNYQLMGVVSLMIAVKYHESCLLSASDCSILTAGAYQTEQILDMETRILQAIDFSLLNPTCDVFLDYYLMKSKLNHNISHYANYIAHRSLMEYQLLKYRPSLVAASSILFSLLHHVGKDERETAFKLVQEKSHYKREVLEKCYGIIFQHLEIPIETKTKRKLEAAKVKFSFLFNDDV